MNNYNFKRACLQLLVFNLIIISLKLVAITVDSSSGFDVNYPASNTIDGIYVNNNMAQILSCSYV